MIKKIIYLYFLILFILITGCSFDKKTGIWSGEEKEIKRIEALEREQQRISNTEKIYSSHNTFAEEIKAIKTISLSQPTKKNPGQCPGQTCRTILEIFIYQE